MGCSKLLGTLLTMCLVVAPLVAEASMSCSEIIGQLEPCILYLENEAEPSPPGGCCVGVKSVKAAVVTTRDRQSACCFLESAAKSIHGLNVSLAAGLPGKCSVSIPFKISPSTNCNSVE